MKMKTIVIVIFVVFVSGILLYSIYLSNTSTKKEIVSAPIAIPLEDLVGQRFIWGITGPTLSTESATLITDTHASGVIIMGELTSGEIASLTAQIQTLPHTEPFIIAIDQEGGSVKRMSDDENPGGYTLGQTDDKTFCETISQTNAKLGQSGVNTNFGIIGDIGWFPDAYITKRTYGNTAESVLAKTTLALQCSKPMLTTIKHFPGHGRTLLNSHLTIPTIQTPYDEWLGSDAQPFLESIKQGVDIVMFGHLRYESMATEPASLSPFFHTFLKNQGFTGLTITDALGMVEDSGAEPIATMKQAFDAENDLLLYVTSKKDPYRLFREAIMYATSSSRLNDSFRQHYNHIKTFKNQKLAF